MLIPQAVFHVSKCAARESTRYAIKGVNVERLQDGKCVATTTDGRRLISASWRDGIDRESYPGATKPADNFTAIVTTEQWNKAGQLIPKRKTLKPILRRCDLDETSANGSITMSAHDTDHKRHEIDDLAIVGHFPNYQQVVPDYTVGKDAVEIGVDPKLLAELLKAMGAIACDCESKGVRLVVPMDPKRPMMMTASANGVEATGVLMPVNLKAC